jgi:hypothetical protein
LCVFARFTDAAFAVIRHNALLFDHVSSPTMGTLIEVLL